MLEKLLFRGRQEEIPFFSSYLLISLKRDKVPFKTYSKKFDDVYIEKFEAQKTIVDKLINPFHLTAERKVITGLVQEDYSKIRNMVNKIEDYVKLTETPLTISAADFGIKGVRKELLSKNDEGIVSELKIVFKNTEDNKLALESAGYSTEISAEFSELIDSLKNDSIDQNLKLDSRIALTQENIKEINKLWRIMDQVLESGKKIAREAKNDLMHKDYTFTHVIKKVRQVRNGEIPPPSAAPEE